MKMSPQQFLDWESKSITTLSNKLPKDKWFHYSGDYRIGTKYLEEPILDNIKQQAMGVPFLRDLLKSDSIYICSNISVENLSPVSSFLGKLGNPDQGGLSLAEFKRRQALHHQAEVAAMNDVPEFIHKAEAIYGYKHFINDAGGSVCELDDPTVMERLAEHTLIVYISIPESLEHTIIERAKSDPKPLYYRPEFVDEKLAEFMLSRGYTSTDQINPNDFVSWVFPVLFRSRVPRYEAIAKKYGYTISANDTAKINTEAEFLQLIAQAIAQQQD
jgi:hypothetical protein